jgi:hypothetical protein
MTLIVQHLDAGGPERLWIMPADAEVPYGAGRLVSEEQALRNVAGDLRGGPEDGPAPWWRPTSCSSRHGSGARTCGRADGERRMAARKVALVDNARVLPTLAFPI